MNNKKSKNRFVVSILDNSSNSKQKVQCSNCSKWYSFVKSLNEHCVKFHPDCWSEKKYYNEKLILNNDILIIIESQRQQNAEEVKKIEKE